MSQKFLIFVLITVALAFLALFASALPALAANQVVSDCGDSGGANHLRAKITAAQSSGGGTISFTCTGKIKLTNSSPTQMADISTNLTIDGGNKITVDANTAAPFFHVLSNGHLTLKNITLINGSNVGDGGAIYNDGNLTLDHATFSQNYTTAPYSGGAIFSTGTLDITNSEFDNNHGGNGGALMLFHSASKTTITNTEFHDNGTENTTDGWGGAILVFDGATLTVNASTIRDNQGLEGGGIHIFQSGANTSATVNTSYFYGNGSRDGGAFFNNAGTLNLTTSTLDNNAGSHGGGIYNEGASNVTNSTLSDNSVSYDGGAIYNKSGLATLTNTSLVKNFVTPNVHAGTTGGIFLELGSISLRNVLIAKGATGQNCSPALVGTTSLSDDPSCNFGTGRDNVNLHLGSLANNGGSTLTFLPLTGSPAINGGTNSGCPSTDQRGFHRPQGALCDVGSVEVDLSTPTPTRTATRTPTRTPIPTATPTGCWQTPPAPSPCRPRFWCRV